MGGFSDKQIITYAIILVLVILVIGFSAYFLFFKGNVNIPVVGDNRKEEIEKETAYEELKNNFSSIFTNTVRKNFTLSSEPQRVDNNKEIVFTQNELDIETKDKYDINVNIPHINLVGSAVDQINNEIDRTFGDKVNSVIQSTDVTTIYNVDYIAYINDDMLSLVIRATLKENDMPQRMIIKTYNYNFLKQEQVFLGDLIIRNNLDRDTVQQKIHEEIGKVITANESLEANGYTVYKRYLSNNRYLLGNIDTYFIDQNNYLFIVFAYGNQNYTNELDLVIF